MKYTYEQLASMIDHSLLHPTMTEKHLREGCELAARYKVVSVCIKPYAVPLAAELLKGTGVEVGTVIGFPHGSNPTEIKVAETKLTCQQGATEIDVVANIGKVLEGDWEYVEADLRAVTEESHKHNAIVKVIFENDFLPDDATKIKLCQICEAIGAEFVKTSTGYGFVKQPDGNYSYKGATHPDLNLMRANSSEKVQVKAAGGVRTLDDLIAVRDLGVTRCGATATAQMLDEYRKKAGLEPIAQPANDSTSEAAGY